MTEFEIIDRIVFFNMLESMGSDVDFMNELVEAYLATSPEFIDSIQQAYAAGDAATLQRAAHTLKTGSASFGALSFAAQCKELEEIGKKGELGDAGEKITSLKAAYAGVAAALQASVQSARTAAG